jgi:predicted DsbA family dithiol-disulfide isomerase
MTDSSLLAPIRVDIVSDVVCPWCAIGYRQLATAAEAEGIALDIHWHPFELNPTMPPEGEGLREHLMRKYGISKADSDKNRERITALGAEVGFPFAFSEEMRMCNTFLAHQLITWAEPKGLAHAAKQALLTAHFTEGRDVSDIAVLAEVAESIGLDAAEAREVLLSGVLADRVREKEQTWTSQGVTGVPTMVFAGKYLGNGAMGVETYKEVLRKVTEEA